MLCTSRSFALAFASTTLSKKKDQKKDTKINMDRSHNRELLS